MSDIKYSASTRRKLAELERQEGCFSERSATHSARGNYVSAAYWEGRANEVAKLAKAERENAQIPPPVKVGAVWFPGGRV